MSPENATYGVVLVWDTPDDWGEAFEAMLDFDDTKHEPCEGRVRAWIYRHLRRSAIDRHRKRATLMRNRERLAFLAEDRRYNSERPVPHEDEVDRVVSFCESKGLTTLLDYARSGQKLHEYAEAAGMPLGSLKSRLHRERKALEGIRDDR